MQTLTIQANENFINEIKELVTQKAKALNEKVNISKVDPIKEELLKDIADYKAGKLETLTLEEMKANITTNELNKRAKEALQGVNLLNEKEAFKEFQKIKDSI